MAAGFSVCTKICGDRTILGLKGRCDCRDSAGLLREAIAYSLRRSSRVITIDLLDADRIDACVLGIFARAHAAGCSSGVVLTITNPSSVVREMFRVTGLEKLLLPSAPLEEDAR